MTEETLDAFTDPRRHYTCAHELAEGESEQIFKAFPWAEVIMLPHGYVCRNNPTLVIG